MRSSLALAVLLVLGGCGQFPRDAEDTLKRAKAGTPLKVGWSVADPWVRRGSSEEPTGLEADLLRAWAKTERVRLDWVEGSEGQLVEGLRRNRVDLAVAGFTHKTPHSASIGMTQPYLSVAIVIGVAAGAPVPEDWEGVAVRYDRRRPDFAAAIASAKAVPVPGDPGVLRPYAAVYHPELAALGLSDTGKKLLTEKRVIASAPAENALALSLDKFLHARKLEIETRLGAEAGR